MKTATAVSRKNAGIKQTNITSQAKLMSVLDSEIIRHDSAKGTIALPDSNVVSL